MRDIPLCERCGSRLTWFDSHKRMIKAGINETRWVDIYVCPGCGKRRQFVREKCKP